MNWIAILIGILLIIAILIIPMTWILKIVGILLIIILVVVVWALLRRATSTTYNTIAKV